MIEKFNRLYIKAVHGAMLLKNKRINRKIVVFESDDWGSVRVPSIESLNKFQQNGIQLAQPQTYDRYDTLASNDDLELLMEVLSSVKDVSGNPAKITLNCCVANPDFSKIREGGFQKYYYEPFTETLKRYPNHDRSFSLWKEGINHKVFQPQFHGREHLNPQKWLGFLKAGRNDVLTAFFEGCYSVKFLNDKRLDSFLEAYKIESPDEKPFVKESIKEGLDLFEKLFGFRSESMIAPCYTWDNYIEKEAASRGVRVIQGGYIQKQSIVGSPKGYVKGHFMGECNTDGQVYLVRNCLFEPTQISTNNALSCLNEISQAFRSHVPAIVSCHRLNFIGELSPDNRDRNLREFKKLLSLIVEKYPDVLFMSSDECGRLYAKG